MVWDILLDALLDSLKLLPFIFVIYIIIELIESKNAVKDKTVRLLNGKLSPLFGAGIGIIPQCGFSVVATKLYQQKYIYAGTLMAVYMATSDEAIPVLLSQSVTDPTALSKLWQLLLIKFGYAIIVGFVVNFIAKRKGDVLYKATPSVQHTEESRLSVVPNPDSGKTVSISSAAKSPLSVIPNASEESDSPKRRGTQSAQEESNPVHSHAHTHDDHSHHEPDLDGATGCCHHEIAEQKGFWRFIWHPIEHSLKIFAYILVVNVIFGLVIELWIGVDSLAEFMAKSAYAQPFVVGLVGMIPNCASSVVISQLLVKNTITLGGALAGLTANSGIALAVLFQDRKNLKNNIIITLLMYVLSVLLGIVVTLLS